MQDNTPLVLVVDDEPANYMLLARLLGQHFLVHTAADGRRALDLIAQHSFDLVLLDIMMPDMNGLAVLQHIRQNKVTADLPVVLVSALSESGDIARGLDMGANDYIPKPIDLDVTLARCRTQVALKQLQDERKHTIAALTAAQEMKDRFLGIASHDLKGPLMNITMAARLLERNSGDENSVIFESLYNSVDTMQNVIEDFLDTAALQVGALHLNLDAVPLNQLVPKLAAEHHHHATKKGICVEIGSLDGVIVADTARFQQAFSNLLSNAIKYSPLHSTVRVWSQMTSGGVCICVADEGPGIPPEEQNLLFTQFAKLTPRPTDGESSTGLGLWIVRHLVTLQNGNVGVECPPEGGSIFWIEMPAA